MLEKVVRSFVPVEAFTKERQATPEILTPEVGLRCGKPSKFDWSATNKDSSTPNGVGVRSNREIKEYLRFYDVEPTINYRIVYNRREDGTLIKINRISDMWFYHTETLSDNQQGSPRFLTTNVGLYFDLYPPSDEES